MNFINIRLGVNITETVMTRCVAYNSKFWRIVYKKQEALENGDLTHSVPTHKFWVLFHTREHFLPQIDISLLILSIRTVGMNGHFIGIFQVPNLCDMVWYLTREDSLQMIRKEVVVAYSKVGLLSKDLPWGEISRLTRTSSHAGFRARDPIVELPEF